MRSARVDGRREVASAVCDELDCRTASAHHVAIGVGVRSDPPRLCIGGHDCETLHQCDFRPVFEDEDSVARFAGRRPWNQMDGHLFDAISLRASHLPR